MLTYIYKLNYIWKLLINPKYELYNFPQHTIEISLDSNSILEKENMLFCLEEHEIFQGNLTIKLYQEIFDITHP